MLPKSPGFLWRYRLAAKACKCHVHTQICRTAWAALLCLDSLSHLCITSRLEAMDQSLRGLTVWAQAGTIQQHDSDQHTMTEAGHADMDDGGNDVEDHANGGHDAEHDEEASEDEVLGDDAQASDEEMAGDSMDDEQADEASGMSMDPPGQSGYPAYPGDEDEEKYGPTSCGHVDPTASSEGKAAHSEVIYVSDGSSDDGSKNVCAQSVEPEGSINMQAAQDSTFLAAVKKQSKVKEGDWLEVRRQSSSGDYGVIDIG